MKITVLLGLVLALFVVAPNAMAVDKTKAENPIIMQEVVLGGAVDSKVAFYQKRIYLVDSEFKILADIGKDAVAKIRFLTANRQNLINNMMSQDVQLTRTKLSAFLGNKMNSIGTTMEAYSSE